MVKKEFLTSNQLMEAVRSLDYKQQYKVCEKFYKILKGQHEDSRVMYQRFYESFELIDPEGLEEYMVELHWSINDMDNALYETDSYTPMEFFEIAEKLARQRPILFHLMEQTNNLLKVTFPLATESTVLIPSLQVNTMMWILHKA